MVPFAPIITGIILVLTFHKSCSAIVASLYFSIFSTSFLITFPSPETATSTNVYISFPLSRIMLSGLLLGILLLLLFKVSEDVLC